MSSSFGGDIRELSNGELLTEYTLEEQDEYYLQIDTLNPAVQTIYSIIIDANGVNIEKIQ